MFFRKKHFMLLTILITIILLLTVKLNIKEENIYKNISSSINEENIKNIVEELSSEKYNGRLIGTKGNKLATDYIVDEFKRMGLKNPEGLKGYEQTYRQNVRFTNTSPKLLVLDNNDKIKREYKYIEDFSVVTYNSLLSIKGEARGTGIVLKNVDELSKKREKFEGKIILVPKELLKREGFREIGLSIIENKLNVKGIIVEVDVEKKKNSTFPVAPNAPPVDPFSDNGAILFTTEEESFAELVKSVEDKREIYMHADYSIENVKGSNVIGIIEGTDDSLKDEHVIIGAHFDHVGDNKDGSYNPGALDNASGTASMIEIAKTIMRNKIQPKKTIVFIAFNGEEEGLYGSYHYVENPLYTLNNKTVMINLDMVGSKRKVPLEVVSSDSRDIEIRDEFLRLGKELGLRVKSGVSQGSDHVPFTDKGVKSVCLINMDLESGYHTPVDTKDKVDEKRSKEISKLVLYYLDQSVY